MSAPSPAPRSDQDSGRVLEVSRFAVLPAAQGRGIGRAMLDGLIRSARAQDVTRLVGVSAPNMAGAHRLYTRVGALTAPAPDGTIFALDLQEQQRPRIAPTSPTVPPRRPRSPPAANARGDEAIWAASTPSRTTPPTRT